MSAQETSPTGSIATTLSGCKHRRILVITTFTLDRERAVCLECDEQLPEWRLLDYRGRAFWYRYLPPEDFLNGVVPRIRTGA